MLCSAYKGGLHSWPQLRCRFSRNASLTPTPTHPETGLYFPLLPMVTSTVALTSLCFNHLFTGLSLLYWKFFKARSHSLGPKCLAQCLVHTRTQKIFVEKRKKRKRRQKEEGNRRKLECIIKIASYSY
ncbi:hypothetical protein HJG60_010496 [Phyllostomus discolor]|uniref:Uncharacterized protein n=1 Tax=Phyllostomus discolor TaxID=89673 RepID=A0A834ARD5_9CHIR|nr:hypothetical protein HJG60_010496 [Phyllostomus discolor]